MYGSVKSSADATVAGRKGSVIKNMKALDLLTLLLFRANMHSTLSSQQLYLTFFFLLDRIQSQIIVGIHYGVFIYLLLVEIK